MKTIIVKILIAITILATHAFAAEESNREVSYSGEQSSIEGEVEIGRLAASAIDAEDGEVKIDQNTAQVFNIDVDKVNGSATVDIELELPEGRNDQKPDFKLTYNSNMRNGILGKGWDINFEKIEYKNKKYYVINDKGRNELVLRDWDGDGINDYYGTKAEIDYTQYEYNKTSLYWIGTRTNGTRCYYGTTSGSRSGNFSYVSKIEDANGNYIEIDYTPNPISAQPREIRYSGPNPFYKVKFGYIIRNDTDYTYDNASFEFKSLLSLIVVCNNANEIVRVYEFKYDQSGTSKASLLKTLIKHGHDISVDLGTMKIVNPSSQQINIAQNTYSGTQIGFVRKDFTNQNSLYFVVGDFNGDGKKDLAYDRGTTSRTVLIATHNAASNQMVTTNGPSILPVSSVYDGSLSFKVDKFLFAGDFNNDGKDDLLAISEINPGKNFVTTIAISKGDGTWSTTEMNGPTGVFDKLYNSVGVGDWNGDGLADFFVNHFCYVNKNGTWEKYKCGEETPYYDILRSYYSVRDYWDSGSDSIAYLDMDSDGDTDIVQYYRIDTKQYSDSSLKRYLAFNVMYSNRDLTYAYGRTQLVFEGASPYRFNFADLNNDGLRDIVCSRVFQSYSYMESELYCAINKGLQFEAYEVRSPIKWPNVDPYRHRFVINDINFDGKDDIIFADKIHLSKGNGQFDTIGGGAIGFNPRTVADLNGDAIDDYIGDIDVEYFSSTKLWLSTAGTDFDKLVSITNEYGGGTAFSYASSANFPNANMPFVLPVVTRMSKSDGIFGSYIYNYSYAQGLYSKQDQSFLGFGVVAVTRPDQYVEHWRFMRDIYRKGLPYSIEIKDAMGNLLEQKSFWWRLYLLDSTTNSRFVYLEAKQSTLQNASHDYIKESYAYNPQNGLLGRTVIEGTNALPTTHRVTYENCKGWNWRQKTDTILDQNGNKQSEVVYFNDTSTGNRLSAHKWVNRSRDIYTGGFNYNTYAITKYKYDQFGNVVEKTDPNGTITANTWDAATNSHPITVSLLGFDEAELHTNYTYDTREFKLSSESDGNNTINYSYDYHSRLVKQSDLTSETKNYTYIRDARGHTRIAEIITYDSRTSNRISHYDGLNRKIRDVEYYNGANCRVTFYRYNWMNSVVKAEGPYHSSTVEIPINEIAPSNTFSEAISYDWLNRPTLYSRTLESSTADKRITYDGFSRTIIDEDGNKKTETINANNQIVQITEFNGSDQYKTAYVYNSLGKVIELTKSDSTKILFEYDSLGRKILEEDTDLGKIEFAYDSNDNLIWRNDNSLETFMSYDGFNRLTKKTYSNGEPESTYTYDLAINGLKLPYEISSAQFKKRIDAYNFQGKPTSITYYSNELGQEYNFSFTYGLAGNIRTITYPDGYSIGYLYYNYSSEIGQIYTQGDNSQLIKLITYTKYGHIKSITFGNDVQLVYTYDDKSARLKNIKIVNGNYVLNKDYSYSSANDITKITDILTNTEYAYLYDDLHRLISEQSSNGDSAIYEYDSTGNMLRHDVSVADPNVKDPSNIPDRTIEFNSERLPVRIEQTTGSGKLIATFGYDGENRRVKKAIQGHSPDYYINQYFEVIKGNPEKYIWVGSLRVAKITSQGIFYFHKDHLGSSTLMTDSAKNVIEKSGYMPFGQTRYHQGTNATNYKFTDQELDPETGLYYYDARYYDPVAGRFISPDLLLPDMFDPQQLNRFAYCRNNPLIYTDPTGHSSVIYGGNLEIGNPPSYGGYLSPSFLNINYMVNHEYLDIRKHSHLSLENQPGFDAIRFSKNIHYTVMDNFYASIGSIMDMNSDHKIQVYEPSLAIPADVYVGAYSCASGCIIGSAGTYIMGAAAVAPHPTLKTAYSAAALSCWGIGGGLIYFGIDTGINGLEHSTKNLADILK
ncbi:RHS repeat-associated core domain-containing protein [Desulfocurvibacter africanus]|uniref:RHS repeat-associated core domain-containing protein n=1 Tax=Desulfocurvibacter africanus TaxID=873 RepID=UPI002FD8FBA0